MSLKKKIVLTKSQTQGDTRKIALAALFVQFLHITYNVSNSNQNFINTRKKITSKFTIQINESNYITMQDWDLWRLTYFLNLICEYKLYQWNKGSIMDQRRPQDSHERWISNGSMMIHHQKNTCQNIWHLTLNLIFCLFRNYTTFKCDLRIKLHTSDLQQ